MRVLLDTHAVLWALLEPGRLPQRVADAIRDPKNEVVVSAATAWEVAIKASVGKLDLPGPADPWFLDACEKSALGWLEVSARHALRVFALPWHHRDPFDRLLVAQAADGYALATRDPRFRDYGVSVLWD